jgi:hypothetical protein
MTATATANAPYIGLDLVTIPNPDSAAATLAEQPDTAAALAAARIGNRAGILQAWPGITLGNASKPEALTTAVERAIEKLDTGAALAALTSAPDAVIAAIGICILPRAEAAIAERVCIYDARPRSPFDSPEVIFSGEAETLRDFAELIGSYGAPEIETLGPQPRQLRASHRILIRSLAHLLPRPMFSECGLWPEITSLAQWTRATLPRHTAPPPRYADAVKAANDGDLGRAAKICAERAEYIARIGRALDRA